MELFNDQGCLTDEGLANLQSGALGELQRLEAAEHLAYCDRCLKRYTDLLTAGELMQPTLDLEKPVRRSLMLNLMRSGWGRFTVAAAAVVLAFGMWQGGFSRYALLRPQLSALSAAPSASFHQASDAFFSAFGSLQQGLDKVFTLPKQTQQEESSHAS